VKCPNCQSSTHKIEDSRKLIDRHGQRIRRRRTCTKCKSRFTTYEIIELNPIEKYKPHPGLRAPRNKKKPKEKKKKPKEDWVKRIMRMLDNTETSERIIRKEI